MPNDFKQSITIVSMLKIPFNPHTCCVSMVKGITSIEKAKSLEIYAKKAVEEQSNHLSLTRLGTNLTTLLNNLQQSPYINGHIPFIELHPKMQYFVTLMCNSGLNASQIQQCNMGDYIKSVIDSFKKTLLTREYNQCKENWENGLTEISQELDSALKSLSKKTNIFDMQEITCCYPLSRMLMQTEAFKSQATFAKAFDAEIVRLICQSNSTVHCIMVKQEITCNGCLIRRYLVFSQRQYIDDPIQKLSPRLIESIRKIVTPNNSNSVQLESQSLNGYIENGLFLKSLPEFKEKIKLLKNYLIGIDTFIRIGGDKPSLSILYSKDNH